MSGSKGPGPTISVVVPAHNEERYIAEALRSVLAQTSPPHEVIVVDDGSADATPQIVEGFGEGVRLIQQANLGCPGAFDTGFREASGDYVALCPADDVWVPRKLEWQQDVLAADPAIDVVFGGARRFGLVSHEHARPAAEGTLDPVGFAREMYSGNVIADPSAVVRRSLYLDLGGYEPLVGEDYEFWMRALRARARFHYDPRLVVRLREHGGNLSNRALELWETHHLVHTRYAELADDLEQVRRATAHDLLMIGYCRAALGRRRDARRAFRGSLSRRFSPLTLLAAAVMSVPGVARAVSELAPRVRRALSSPEPV